MKRYVLVAMQVAFIHPAAGFGLQEIIELPRRMLQASACQVAAKKFGHSCGADDQEGGVLKYPTESAIRHAMCSSGCVQDTDSFLTTCLGTTPPQKVGLLNASAIKSWCQMPLTENSGSAFCGLDGIDHRENEGFNNISYNCEFWSQGQKGSVSYCLDKASPFVDTSAFASCIKNTLCSSWFRPQCSDSIHSYVHICASAATRAGMINMSNYRAWCSSPNLLPY